MTDPAPPPESTDSLALLAEDVSGCRRCPRLVDWREEIAATKRAAFADEEYWGRGVPGFGDPGASLVVMGLAPAAHGANRTGRMFTGDRSGDWLYRGLWKAGFANQPESVDVDDGLRLVDAWVTSPVKCAPPANKPTAAERDNCRPFLEREMALLRNARVIVALGKFGFDQVRAHFAPGDRTAFSHGVELRISDRLTVLGCYHVSQQNTFTGRLTEDMLNSVFGRARELSATGTRG